MAAATARPEAWPALPEREGYEYVDGKWVKIPMGAESTWVASELFTHLHAYARRRRNGVALAHETSFQIWPTHPQRYRKPDGAFLGRGKLPNDIIPVSHINAVPDLVVEVVSPFDRGDAIEQKLGEYHEAGVPLVWVIYPRQRRVHVYRVDGSARVIDEDGYLDGEDVMPGFRVAVKEILPPGT